MKKIISLFVVGMLILFTGCESRAITELKEKTNTAISGGNYEEAEKYSSNLVREGCKDEAYIQLAKILVDYNDASEALKDGKWEKAEELYSKIGNCDNADMNTALKALGDSIEETKKYFSEITEKIQRVEEAIIDDRVYTAASDAKALLKKEGLTSEQKEYVQKLLDKAEAGKKGGSTGGSTSGGTGGSTSGGAGGSSGGGGKAILNSDEAITLARTAMNKPDAKASATLMSDYYLVNFEEKIYTGGEIITDEACCKVDALTGRVYDMAG